jgi:glutamyl/glutaminyl-tRNA synthetase
MQSDKLILVTGIERSGSTLITRVLQLCGANAGRVNKMRENEAIHALNASIIKANSEECHMPNLETLDYAKNLDTEINNCLIEQRLPATMPFVYKDSGLIQIWPIWNTTYPDAKWIIVRRRTGDIINSFVETAYMKKFKDVKNLKLVGAETERDGWLWWVKQNEQRLVQMIEAGINHRIVWPERMRDGDFEQMKEVVDWCGLEWNEDVVNVMSKLLK